MIHQIDRKSPLPLYFQLKQILLDKIQSGEWKPGELIPGELLLEEQYQVSRTVVRQTLSELVIEGYLTRHRGKGTFIAQPKVAYDPARRLELNDYMEQQGVVLSWRLIDRGLVEAPPHIADILRVADGAQVYCLRRLRLAGSDAIGHHTAYLPQRLVSYIDEAQLCAGESLSYLMRHPSLGDPRVERTLEASLAEKEDAELLGVKRQSPILHLERLVTDAEGKPIEFLVARFRGDRFKFQMTN